jgi:hypothetical protein
MLALSASPMLYYSGRKRILSGELDGRTNRKLLTHFHYLKKDFFFFVGKCNFVFCFVIFLSWERILFFKRKSVAPVGQPEEGGAL